MKHEAVKCSVRSFDIKLSHALIFCWYINWTSEIWIFSHRIGGFFSVTNFLISHILTFGWCLTHVSFLDIPWSHCLSDIQVTKWLNFTAKSYIKRPKLKKHNRNFQCGYFLWIHRIQMDKLDTDGYRWRQMDTEGYRWIQMDTLDTDGYTGYRWCKIPI